MKMNKNTLLITILLLTAVGLMGAMISLLFPSSNIAYHNTEELLNILVFLVSVTATIYSFTVIKRVKPVKNIYLSHSFIDNEVAKKIKIELETNLSNSKYRFNIISIDEISFGENIYEAIKNNIKKSEVFIIIISSEYVNSKSCIDEFNQITQKTLKSKDKIIPVILDSFDDLKKLPKDLSSIKSLYLCEKDLSKQLELLAKDLIKQQRELF